MRFLLLASALALSARSGASLAESESVTARAEMQMLNEHVHRLKEFGLGEPLTPERGVHTGEPLVQRALHLLTFALVLKAGAISSSVCMILSPLRTVWCIRDSKSTLKYAPYTFICVFACGLQWCLYGTFAFFVTGNKGFLILVYSNCLGVLMGTYYVFTYFACIQDSTRRSQFWTAVTCAACNLVFQATAVRELSHARSLLLVGTISAVMSVIVTASPIADLSTIVKTRDVSGIPRDVVVASFIASAMWFGCAILLHDTWIFVPNMLGLLLGGLQLYLLESYGTVSQRVLGLLSGPVPLFANMKATYGTLDVERLAESKHLDEPLSPASPPIAYTGGTGGTD